MSRRLDVAMKTTILSLVRQGWSYRRIHRELGADRTAISRCVTEANSKPANPPTGSPGMGLITSQTRPPGPGSSVEPFREIVEAKLQLGLDATRIFHDLAAESGYGGAYDAVKRFVHRLRRGAPEVFARMEVLPGEEGQVDFGQAAPTLEPITGQYKRPHIFKMTLSCSRHSYEEVVWRQTVESFIRCHENAFRFFGGVPKVIRLDNLKAGVSRACLYDPEINVLYQALANHYGFTPLPIRPRTPRHDGKVERGIGYTKNALKGRTFESLEAQNEFLSTWNRTVARLRIHGTTKQQVWSRFLELEKPALASLPADPFPFFKIASRKVHPDGHIELEKSYYSVPHQHVGQRVEVRWDERLVKVLAGGQVVAVHRRSAPPGAFQTKPDHLPVHKNMRQEQYQARLLAQAERLGPGALGFAKGALERRGPLAFRVIQGCLSLCRQYPKEQVEWACAKALAHGSFRYRTVKELLLRLRPRPHDQALTQDHAIIRPLTDYGRLIHQARRAKHEPAN